MGAVGSFRTACAQTLASAAAAVVLVCVGSLVAASTSDVDTRLSGFEMAAQNEALELYYLASTSEIAVRVRDTGSVWFSNPRDRGTAERIARGAAKDRLNAQFSLSYFTPRDELKDMDSYNDSAKLGQVEAARLDNGLRVEYTLGKEWNDDAFLPVMMTEESFGALILGRLSERDRELFLDSYDHVQMVEVSDEYPAIDVYNLHPDVLGNYTLMSPTATLTARGREKLVEGFIDQIVGHRKDLSGRPDMTHDCIPEAVKHAPVYVLKTGVRAWDKEDMIALIKEMGASPADMQQDYDVFGLDKAEPNTVIFRVVLEYRLDGDSLVVRVPVGDLEYPTDVPGEFGGEVSYPPHSIRLLEYFGAAGVDAEGYIFVPDGSGGLIYLNNGKTQMPAYSARVYGLDRALDPPQTREALSQQVYLPVFGMKQGVDSILAVIEEGRAAARINADVAGRTDSYNKVFAIFDVVSGGITSLESWTDWRQGVSGRRQSINVYQARPFRDDMVVRYRFLHGKNAGYPGMARTYQDYLVAKGALRKAVGDKTVGDKDAGDDDLPFVLELIGSVAVKQPVLGVPRDVVKALTTFDQSQEIVDRFADAGVRNMVLRYSGWLQGGLYHSFPDRVRVERAVGGHGALDRLCRHLEESGVELYLDVTFLEVYRNRLLDGFVTIRDAARHLDKTAAMSLYYHPVSAMHQPWMANPILSPRRLSSVVQGFVSGFDRIAASGLSLRQMGQCVDSDFREDLELLVDREQAAEIIADQLRKLVEDYQLTLMVEGGNDYALEYASFVVGAPTSSSKYNLLDRSVPFYQMVLHGYVNYAGPPLNHAQDPIRDRLVTIESGAIPYYQLAYAKPLEVKQTDVNDLYSFGFEDWIDGASEFYTEANRILGRLQRQRIVDHVELAPGVFQTVYEHGQSVLVNYNKEHYMAGRVVVPALGYTLVEEALANE